MWRLRPNTGNVYPVGATSRDGCILNLTNIAALVNGSCEKESCFCGLTADATSENLGGDVATTTRYGAKEKNKTKSESSPTGSPK